MACDRKLRLMTELQQEKWCLGRGIANKKGVCSIPFDYDMYANWNLQQLRTWFRWRQSRLTHSTGEHSNGSRSVTASIATLLGSATTKGRLLTSVEKYSKLFFPTHVRHLVAEALLVYGDNPNHSQTLTTIKRVTMESWEAEDDITRDIVFSAMALDKAKRYANIDRMQNADSESRTPLQYQRYARSYFYCGFSILTPSGSQCYRHIACIFQTSL